MHLTSNLSDVETTKAPIRPQVAGPLFDVVALRVAVVVNSRDGFRGRTRNPKNKCRQALPTAMRLEIEGRKQLDWDETVVEIPPAVLQMPELQVGLHPEEEEVVPRM